MHDNAPAVNRFKELDPQVQEMLSRLEPSEIDTLKYVATIPKDELRGMMKSWRDLKAVSRFMRWAILTIVAVFVGAVAFGESLLKIIGWIKGNPS